MPIAPPNDDAFLREVDEDYRRDRLIGFGRRYGRAIAGAVGVLLLVLAAGLWWRSHRAAQAGADSEALVVALAAAENGGGAADLARLKALEASPREGYRAAAVLAEAGLLQRRGDAAGAARAYQAIAADAGLPQPVRDLATLRGVAAEFDRLSPQAVTDRLKGLAVPGTAFYPGAAELTAVAWLKAGQPQRAAPLLAAIARDEAAPASMRARAAGLATALGQAVTPPATHAP